MNELALLVGSNPLPNVLAALVLKPSKIWLFYSKDTEDAMRSIKDTLKTKLKLKNKDFEEKHIPNPFSAKSVVDILNSSSLPKEIHLNYTGGTKVMSAQARMYMNQRRDQCSYIVERDSALVYDTDRKEYFKDHNIKLSLDELFTMHGINPKEKNKKNSPDDETIDYLMEYSLKGRESLDFLHSIHYDNKKHKLKNVTDARKNALNLSDVINSRFGFENFPDDTMNSKPYEDWCKLFKGTWLEHWVLNTIKKIIPDEYHDENYLRQSVYCIFPSGRNFEIDIVLIVGHRLYAISCTTSYGLSECKLKLFEVAYRAKQLGGDLARSALICFADKDMNKLESDVDQIWDSDNKPIVFGKRHLESWFKTNRFKELKKWLQS